MAVAVERRQALVEGFARVEVLDIDNDFWRFYRLHAEPAR